MAIKPGYTRVTEILSPLTSFGHIDPSVLKRKAAIGTEVHQAISLYWEKIYWEPRGRASDYYQSFLLWGDMVPLTPVIWEERFYCDDLMITGAVDALIQFPGSDDLVLVDFKTAASPSDTWPLQAMFYHYLAEKNGYSLSSRIFFVMLSEGKRAPRLMEYKATRALWSNCEQALKNYRDSCLGLVD